MPPADVACKVINAKSGCVRDNTSWVIGRIMRDYDYWMDVRIATETYAVVEEVRKFKAKERDEKPAREKEPLVQISRVGLTVAIYQWMPYTTPGHPKRDLLFWSGFIIIVLQLRIASIPLALFGDWGILMVTSTGTMLALPPGSLPQWKKEK